MDKNTVKQFRTDFESMAKLFEQKYNVKLNIGTIRFDNTSFRCTLNALEKQTPIINVTPGVLAAANPKDNDSVFISMMAKTQNVALDLHEKGFVGSMYRLPGKRSAYTVTGVNRRAPKFCVEVKTDSGARYKMPITALNSAVLIGHE